MPVAGPSPAAPMVYTLTRTTEDIMRHITYTDRTDPEFGEHEAAGFWGERLHTGSRTFHASPAARNHLRTEEDRMYVRAWKDKDLPLWAVQVGDYLYEVDDVPDGVCVSVGKEKTLGDGHPELNLDVTYDAVDMLPISVVQKIADIAKAEGGNDV